MKYLRKCSKKLTWYVIILILLMIIDSIAEAKLLQWIAQLTNDPTNHHILTLIIVTCIISTLVSICITKINAITPNILYTDLINMFVDKLLHAEYKMYTSLSPGYLSTIRDVPWKYSKIVRVVSEVMFSIATIVTNIVMLLLISPIIAIIAGLIYTLNGILVYRVNQVWRKLDSEADDLKIERNKEFDQIINGYAEARTHCAEEMHMSSIYQKNMRILQILRTRSNYSVLIESSINITTDTLTVAILLYLIILLRDNSISSATAVTIIIYIWRMIKPILNIIWSISDFTETIVAGKKFTKVMDYEDTTSDGSIELVRFENEIRFNNVSFSYDNSDTVLQNINLTIKKGEHVGLCGTSGEGKSTLTKLIPKFYDVSDGVLEIDGIDVKRLSNRSIRSHIGIVQQEPYIFDTSFEENVKYGSPHATHDEIVEACKRAAIYNFIMQTPERFDTNVGPKGLKLSGGQKQRLALARIFLANPDIIILDEATSGLDNETESLVQDSLNMFKDKTMIVIAHRLSTIRDSDKIIVLDNHTIAECGTHEELLDKDGVYKRLQK